MDGVAAIAREIAQEEGMTFRLGLAYSQLISSELRELWDEGRIHPLEPAPVIDRTTLERSTVVAMMGVEPIEHLLSEGCDVILTGRTSDTALFAALPDLLGADPGLNWHAAKTVECGAACAIPPTAGGLLARIRSDHFTVETLDPGSRLTPRSVAAHTLYENADPYQITEPAGVLDT
ncbi:MAG TPA: acyclic terpene utilization AtuA family protein, partial [Ilumatobacteraceae bacterium]